MCRSRVDGLEGFDVLLERRVQPDGVADRLRARHAAGYRDQVPAGSGGIGAPSGR